MNTKARPYAIIFKALCLFVLVNLVYALVEPPVAEISIYNTLIPGLRRMPFGDSTDPYTVTMDNVDAMFASHEISAEKNRDEIRVVVIGDSSVWGEGLSSRATLAGQWNQLNFQCNGKKIKVYNLGYPHPSIIKDLIFMDKAMARKPDAVIWFVTLNTLMNQYRLNPFLTGNRERAVQVIDTYNIPFAPRKTLEEQEEGFYQKTLMGQRSFLARWIRLQALGLIWSATGDDLRGILEYPDTQSLSMDVKKDSSYRELEPGSDLRPSLLLESFQAGLGIADTTPMLLVNEPIYVATGMNSDIRYNDLYPRWAYDQYREILSTQTQTLSLLYRDMWNTVPSEYFIDTGLHLNPSGERLLAEQLNPTLLSMVCP